METTAKSVSAAEIRAVISRFREHRRTGEKSGEHYLVDRSNAESYMEPKPANLRGKVYDFLRSLREKDEPAVYVDVCGRAKLSLADVNYSFSLQQNRWKADQVAGKVCW